jgi:large subunit ribosomal protein L3
MKFILGTKLNMTQIFDKDGIVHPATAVLASPNVITRVKSVESDGYAAVAVGQGSRNAKNVNKAQKGEWKDMGSFKAVKEFRVGDVAAFKAGDKIDLAQFKEGDSVSVSGITKGKGFQGVVKRHGFHGGPRTHGQKHSEREPGSIGGGLRNKVPKKMRMAGRMGGDRVTVKGLKVVHIDAAANLLYLSGAVPGHRGTLLEISGK